MAKQSGIHQIKGKIGEYSYYKQTGVSGGLIRGINQGMSARVKTDAAYANTRLNNQEFGAAADTASLLGKTVVPKFRPMILPFSQSKMAKEVLKVARTGSASWGQRVVTSADTAKLCEILTAQSKLNLNDFASFSIARLSAAEAEVQYKMSADQVDMLLSLGITHVTAVATQYDIATGQWVPLAQEMSTGYIVKNDSISPLNGYELPTGDDVSGSENMDVATFVPAANHAGHQIVVIVFMPSREINSVSHILQEYCCFAAFELPAA